MTARGWHLMPLAVPIMMAACDAERIAAPAHDGRSESPPVQLSVESGGLECSAPDAAGKVVCTLAEGSATWIAPAGIATNAVVFELRGGSGGSSTSLSPGGMGGITIASRAVTAGTRFDLIAGGRGADGGTGVGAGAGGANGGGAGGVSLAQRGAGGGGASTVSCVAPTGCTVPVLIAAGGGGGPLGGHGGATGTNATAPPGRGGQGATGSSAGAGGTTFGVCTGSGSSGTGPPSGGGGAGGGGFIVFLVQIACPPGGGGGAGLFGGGGGAAGEFDLSVPAGGGGGGSGRIAPGFTNVVFATGHVGNGSVTITYYVQAPKVTITVVEAIDAQTQWYNLASSGSDGVVVKVSAPDAEGLTCVIDGETVGMKSNAASIPLDDGSHTISCTGSIGQLTGAGPGSTPMPLQVDVDQTPPTLEVAIPKGIGVGSTAAAIPVADDATSGVAAATCPALDTSTSGFREVTCTAMDHAGNVTTTVAGYYVESAYVFSGFLAPLSADKVNQVQAGRAVPVKFSLSGDFGLNIMMPGYPTSQVITCPTGDLVDEVEGTLSAGSSSLSYDAATDVYTYTWKTQNSWAGSCRLLLVRLNDGSTYTASFSFRK